MLEVIGEAGVVVSTEPGPQGNILMTATAEDGETWQVRSDSEVEGVVKLAEMLGFEDLD